MPRVPPVTTATRPMFPPLFARSCLPRSFYSAVIPRLGLGIHEFLSGRSKLVDAKAKPWHD
jgi:hypothetical protein